MWGEGGVCEEGEEAEGVEVFEEGEEAEGMEVCGEGVEVFEEGWRCVRVKRWRGDGERYVEGAWEGVEL